MSAPTHRPRPGRRQVARARARRAARARAEPPPPPARALGSPPAPARPFSPWALARGSGDALTPSAPRGGPRAVWPARARPRARGAGPGISPPVKQTDKQNPHRSISRSEIPIHILKLSFGTNKATSINSSRPAVPIHSLKPPSNTAHRKKHAFQLLQCDTAHHRRLHMRVDTRHPKSRGQGPRSHSA